MSYEEKKSLFEQQIDWTMGLLLQQYFCMFFQPSSEHQVTSHTKASL